MSRQLDYQNRMKAENRCIKCGKPTRGYITGGGKFKQYAACDYHRHYTNTRYTKKVTYKEKYHG